MEDPVTTKAEKVDVALRVKDNKEADAKKHLVERDVPLVSTTKENPILAKTIQTNADLLVKDNKEADARHRK